MTKYEQIEQAIEGWCQENNLEYAAENITADGSGLPARYLLYSIISDSDGDFYSNQRTRTTYRVQFDIVVPIENGGELDALFEDFELTLIAANFKPQGNYRWGNDATAMKAYIQKDYFMIVRRDQNG